jgi:UrcA family protein
MSCALKTLTAVVAMAAAVQIDVLFAAPASAQEIISRDRMVVYADLDLAKPEDVDVLLKRLNTASAHACGSRPSTNIHGNIDRYRACREKALAEAVHNVGSPALTLAWQGRNAGVQIAER